MTVYREYYWPKASLDAVALLQVGSPDDPVNLNGKLANYFTNQISFIDAGFSRTISITSANDLSAITFTVSGLQNGVPVTEDITGPNNDTVQGALSFDIITSIFLDGVAIDFSIGTGSVGYLPIIYFNIQAATPIIDFSIQTLFSTTNSLTYNVYNSIAKIGELGLSYDDLLADTNYLNSIESDIQTPQLITNVGIIRHILLQIVSSNGNADDLRVLFLQQ